ncbi:MAG: GntR family transcriptional regulator [Pigmentiphaga sp.]|uniref:GntR family transcriptional regulator n=1 Tax=Pigmentiphaga sp. TaxID=1977564 RepID=UPI0029AF0D71|nr:GntR family transcriptional regulator [Pigmentiphaga sp.]MDX3905655.1 GntR family transcriptional regulator [Pigmentiphaga sp.]
MTSRAKAVPSHSQAVPGQPLYARLREALRADILGGRYQPHDQLPSEAELTASHGVSRITVRQALNDLHKEGLIVKVHGKGSFVAPLAVAQDLTRLRGLSESLGRPGRVLSRTLSMELVAAPEEVAAQFGMAPGARVGELWSLRYLDRQPLSLNHSYMPGEYAERLRRIDLGNRDLLEVYERELRIPVHDADLSIGAVAADAMHAAHLAVRRGAPLLRVRRRLHADGGKPFHLESACYRADMFEYSLNVGRLAR